MIDDSTPIRRGAELIAAEVEGERIVLNGATGTFYQLNVSAAQVWDAIDAPRTLAELCTDLVAKFDVAPDVCRADLTELIAAMRERGLVEIG